MTQELTQEETKQQIKCVSHEIRNHLSICDMYSQIIKKNLEKLNIDNSSINNALDCIQKSLKIIGANLLDLKSIDCCDPKIIDFKSTVECAAELSKVCASEDKEIEFEVFVKNTVPLFTDENRFLACLVNIIKNGVESIETRGKIQILAEVKYGFGIIRISNNGKPIPKDKQERIFTRGYTTKRNGCGLGLAICKQFLNSQNSQIALLKSTKQNTVFEIRIPAVILAEK